MHARSVLGGFVAAGALALTPGAALADATDTTVKQLNKAVAAEGTAPAAPNPDVSIPSNGTGLVTLGGPEISGEVVIDRPEVTVDLPARGAAEQTGSTAVFNSTVPGADIAVQPTAKGVRALVAIDSAEASERYPVTLRGDVARLESQADGSVRAYDADGELIATIAPAWARDRNGRDVPTFYEIEGTTLVQVVKHRGGGFAYGITADPSIEAHWYWPHMIRVWFSRAETERIYRNIYGPSLAAGAANM